MTTPTNPTATPDMRTAFLDTAPQLGLGMGIKEIYATKATYKLSELPQDLEELRKLSFKLTHLGWACDTLIDLMESPRWVRKFARIIKAEYLARTITSKQYNALIEEYEKVIKELQDIKKAIKQSHQYIHITVKNLSK